MKWSPDLPMGMALEGREGRVWSLMYGLWGGGGDKPSRRG